MSAALRLCALYFTAFPVQRWICGAGAALMLLGLLLLVVAPFGPATPLFLLLVLLGVAIVLVAVAFIPGYLLRAWSAPRRHRLLPGFRVRTLAGTLLALAALSALWPAVVVPAFAFIAGNAAPTSAADAVFLFAGLSGWTWTLFIATGNRAGVLALLGVTAALGSAGPYLGPLRELGPTAAHAGAWLVSAGWLVFAAWYLRAETIRPVSSWQRWEKTGPEPAGGSPPRYSVRSATAICLQGRPRRGLPWQAAEAGLALLGLVALWSLHPRARDWPPAALLTALVIIPSVSTAFAANGSARLCRRLWLAGGRSRLALLRLCERRLLTRVAGAAAIVTVLAALLAAATDLQWPAVLGALLLFASTACFAGYLGLMAVRRFRAVDWLAAAVLGATAGMAGAAVLAAFPWPLTAGAVAAQLSGAALCRALAVRRWRAIDWSELRPVRSARGNLAVPTL